MYIAVDQMIRNNNVIKSETEVNSDKALFSKVKLVKFISFLNIFELARLYCSTCLEMSDLSMIC